MLRIDPAILNACWFLAGPTAAGKTAAGLALAERLGAEIIALDSMSLYRGMDIGTAKPTPAERAQIPHHLIDVLEPHQDCSTADYIRRADRACRVILARGRTPLFVGGTGLYLRSVLRGIFPGPPADWPLRSKLHDECRRAGPHALHERLRQVDPTSAERLRPEDVRRVIRSLEIQQLTGVPASALQQQAPLPPGLRPRRVFWLHPPRPWLHERIDRRVQQMFAAGLVQEVAALCDRPGGLGRTARQALGYKEVLDHLAGHATLPETIVAVQRRTRQFAKRQHTWFRNLVECRAVPMTGTESPEQLAELILSQPP